MRRRRSGSASSLTILRAFHMGAGSYNGLSVVGFRLSEEIALLSSCDPLQRIHFLRRHRPRLACLKLSDPDRSDGDPFQGHNGGIESLDHPANLPVAPLGDGDLEGAVVHARDARGPRRPVSKLEAAAEKVELFVGERTAGIDQVAL